MHIKSQPREAPRRLCLGCFTAKQTQSPSLDSVYIVFKKCLKTNILNKHSLKSISRFGVGSWNVEGTHGRVSETQSYPQTQDLGIMYDCISVHLHVERYSIITCRRWQVPACIHTRITCFMLCNLQAHSECEIVR